MTRYRFPLVGKIISDSLIVQELENGKRGIELVIHDNVDNTTARLGFWIESELADGYQGFVAALQVSSTSNPNSGWAFLELMSLIGIVLEARIDTEKKARNCGRSPRLTKGQGALLVPFPPMTSTPQPSPSHPIPYQPSHRPRLVQPADRRDT